MITSLIFGGTSWLDCSVATIAIFFALSRFNSLTSVLSEIIGVILIIPSSEALCKILSNGIFLTKKIYRSVIDKLLDSLILS